MVTVEADVLVGPWLRRFAKERGVIYTMAYGDEPALAVELCDWARALGMQVVAAGKGTRFIPGFRYAVPDDVPRLYGFTGSGYNLKVFCSFLDGTKHAIEMAALANAAELAVDVPGMHFEAIDLRDICDRLCLRESGGILHREGVVEAVSAMRADETWVERHLRGGVYAVVRADAAAVASMRSYGEIIGMHIGKRSGHALIYRPQHFVGHEVPIGVARLILDGQPVGQPQGQFVDVVAGAKRPLSAGTVLDGEGGYTVYGLCENAGVAREQRLLPMALTQNCILKRDIPRDGRISYDDVEIPDSFAFQLRLRQDRDFAPASSA
jgi:predicted homoserine dehydrogenase-like protein